MYLYRKEKLPWLDIGVFETAYLGILRSSEKKILAFFEKL